MTELDVHREERELTEALRTDVRSGLSAEPKSLPSKWFYDARGSRLFEDITALPEYYPTRAEREILAREAGEIARITGARTLVELGSGSSEKTRLLLEGGRDHGALRHFVPLDVSESALSGAVEAIRADYPDIEVHGVVGDFTEHLDLLPGQAPRLVAFLGGTIGNFLPAERMKFLRAVRDVLDAGEWLLLGTDLVKDPATLVAAYDDAAGVTAEFNRNVLRVVNTRLGADFDPDRFAHEAYWDAGAEWIEMRLRAKEAMTIRVPGAGMEISLTEGEYIRTEISAKFRAAGVASELAEAGFAVERWWTDQAKRFGLTLAEARPSSAGQRERPVRRS